MEAENSVTENSTSVQMKTKLSALVDTGVVFAKNMVFKTLWSRSLEPEIDLGYNIVHAFFIIT